MRKLVFATQNKNKIFEIQNQLKDRLELLSLIEIDHSEELEESQETLDGNALQKARFISENYKVDCFADDTGLEIESLEGEPGVRSARYAGESKSFDANMDKVLTKLKGKSNRKAQFRTVIALLLDGEEYLFEGVCKGQILEEKVGEQGFGYDPIFKPDGYKESFAQMSLELKNEISHRGRAVKKLIDFLNTLSKS